MKKALLAVAAGAATLGMAANAEAMQWHAGVFGGYAEGEGDWDFVAPPVNLGKFDMDGSMFGANVGVGHTNSASIYWGVEAEYADVDFSGARPCPNPAFTCGSEIDSVITLRGRIGRDMGPWLVYGAVGAAWGDARSETVLAGVAVGEDNMRNGWTAGAGVERDIGTNMALRAEYTYYDFGSGRSTVHAGEVVDVQITAQALRLGLNWRF